MGHTARWLAVHVHVRETARRKIVKPIRPTNLYNVVRHFYRLATPLANNTSRGRRKKKRRSFHALGAAHARVYARVAVFRDGNERFYVVVKDRHKG